TQTKLVLLKLLFKHSVKVLRKLLNNLLFVENIHNRPLTCLSQVDEGFRRMIWETNQEMDKHTFTLGMNKFGDMTNKEYNAFLDGIPLSKWNCSLSAAPETWDWRQYGYVTPVKNQGSCGSCYEFAAVGALEGQMFKQTGTLLPLSEHNLVDCSGDYHNNGCDGGLAMRCFSYVSDNGIMSERKYPYTAEVGPCEYQNATKEAWCKGFNRVPSLDEKVFRDTLYEVGPIAVSVNATHPSFKFYKDGDYRPNAPTTRLHAAPTIHLHSHQGYSKNR
uniref:Peptidase C1A papain C-terminal domain-containing protein n=1 Tax=Oncorhynchus kisutch TaxID=8019 RepID=A0A8C7IBG7_ONCKI